MATYKRILIFSFIALIVLTILTLQLMLQPNREIEAEHSYFNSLNLTFSGIVKKVIITNEHDYGILFLEKIKSNKSNTYEAIFKNKYVFCKMDSDSAIIVTPGINEILANDSVVINTNRLEEKVYRNKILTTTLVLAINDDDWFYSHITDYLGFSYYKNSKP